MLFLCCLLGAACDKTGHEATYTTVQTDGGCPVNTSVMNGPVPAGGRCDADADCMTVCCPCPDGGTRSFLARVCFDFVCAPDNGCAISAQPGYCP
jgi:hypothetical protein